MEFTPATRAALKEAGLAIKDCQGLILNYFLQTLDFAYMGMGTEPTYLTFNTLTWNNNMRRAERAICRIPEHLNDIWLREILLFVSTHNDLSHHQEAPYEDETPEKYNNRINNSLTNLGNKLDPCMDKVRLLYNYSRTTGPKTDLVDLSAVPTHPVQQRILLHMFKSNFTNPTNTTDARSIQVAADISVQEWKDAQKNLAKSRAISKDDPKNKTRVRWYLSQLGINAAIHLAGKLNT